MKGWHNESKRHSLARRGIKTVQKLPVMFHGNIAKNRMLSDFRQFNQTGAYDEKWVGSQSIVYKVGKTIIKFPRYETKGYTLLGDDDVAYLEKECRVQKLVRDKFKFYPECMFTGTVLLTEFEGNTVNTPITKINLKHKQQIAGVMKYLYEKGTYLEDIRNSNISIDDKDNAVIIDFGLTQKATENNQDAYNLSILGVFGMDYTESCPYLIGDKQRMKEFYGVKNVY